MFAFRRLLGYIESMFSFIWPYLLLLLPTPWVVRRLLPPACKQADSDTVGFLRAPFYRRLEILGYLDKSARTSRTDWVWGLIWLCLVVASMRPVMYLGNRILPQESRNIILALDFSSSMAQRDFVVQNRVLSRTDVVKLVANDFIDKRSGDKLGIVIFGKQAYTLAPLSHDGRTIKELLSEIASDVTDLTGKKTAIGDALAMGVQNSASVPADKKVIVLLSDGGNNAGQLTLKQATDLARDQGVRVYTIGLKTGQGDTPALWRFIGGESAYGWNEQALADIAKQTGGIYFRVDTTADLISVYHRIDELETDSDADRPVRPRRELFFYPLIAAFVLWSTLLGRRKQ